MCIMGRLMSTQTELIFLTLRIRDLCVRDVVRTIPELCSGVTCCSDGVDGNGRNGGKRNKGKGRNNKHQRKIDFGLLPSVLTRTSRRKGRP